MMNNRWTMKFVTLATCATLASLLTVTEAEGQGKRGGGPSLVATSKVVKKVASTTESFIGTLKPVRKSVVGSAVAGRIEQVLVDDGDAVGAAEESTEESFVGQPLVHILRESLDIEIEAAEIELELRQKTYEELLKSLPKEIELAEASVQQAQAQKDYAEQVFKRAESLATDRGISQAELEQGVSQFRIQSQALIAAQSELQRLQSTRDIRLTIVQQRIKAQQAELRRLKDLRSKHTVRTPFPGFVSRRIVEQGDWVSSGDPVAEVVQLNPIELRISIPQAFLGRLQSSFDAATPQQPFMAIMTVDSLEQEFEGRVTQIIPEADERTRALPVVIRVDNPKTNSGYLLRPGLLARASLSIGRPAEILMVHKDALVLGQDQVDIFVVDQLADDSAVARKHTVQTGATDGDLIEIRGDIQENDLVVVRGNERLMDGQPIKIIDGNN